MPFDKSDGWLLVIYQLKFDEMMEKESDRNIGGMGE